MDTGGSGEAGSVFIDSKKESLSHRPSLIRANNNNKRDKTDEQTTTKYLLIIEDTSGCHARVFGADGTQYTLAHLKTE